MDGANGLPQTDYTTSDGSASSAVACNEVAAQGIKQSRLVQSLKDYQNKSPEAVAAILQQWQEIKAQYTQKKADFARLLPELFRLYRVIASHQASSAVRFRHIPPMFDLDQVSTGQLQLFHQALEQETMASEATWTLYELCKRMHASSNALERWIAFRQEHFVLEQQEQQLLDEGKTATISVTNYIRGIGPKLVVNRQEVLDMIERWI